MIYITKKEVCEILSITRNTVDSLVKQNILPVYKVEGTRIVRYKEQDVYEILQTTPRERRLSLSLKNIHTNK
ncbi:helix-turn-helix domain-containing protein [Tenacibaculum finnmarkense]|nr:helix-turn-helix domain-containing protein [Tenacibaculum finnmarkense]